MKTTHFERITTKPVTVQREVREEADVPVLDFTKGAVLELTNMNDLPNSQVFLNGTLLKGAHLVRVEVRLDHWGASKGHAVLHTTRGEVTLAISDYITTEGVVPTTVEWKAKAMPGVCSVPLCESTFASLRSSLHGQQVYVCNMHFEQLHPSRR